MKKKEMGLWSTAFMGVLVCCCTSSYAMDYGGFDVQVGTEEGSFLPENWEQVPENQNPPSQEVPFETENAWGWMEEQGEMAQPEIPQNYVPPVQPQWGWPVEIPGQNQGQQIQEYMEPPKNNEEKQIPEYADLGPSELVSIIQEEPKPSLAPTLTGSPLPTKAPVLSPTPEPEPTPAAVKKPCPGKNVNSGRILEKKEIKYLAKVFAQGKNVQLFIPDADKVNILSCRVNGEERRYQWKENDVLVEYQKEKENKLELVLLYCDTVSVQKS